MLLREVQAGSLQGHHLRALRRRGDPPEGAPRADGSHRPRRPRLAHLVLQGRPEPHRLPPRHRSQGAREGALLRRLDRHARRGGQAGCRPRGPRGQGARRVRAHQRRPRRGPGRARGPAFAPARALHQGQGAELRRGRRVLGPWALQLGRGAGSPDARGGAQAREQHLRGRGQDGHDRGLEEDPGARPQRRRPRRPPARPARHGGRRQRSRADPGGARPACQAGGQGDRLQEGRDHQAHEQDPRRPALGRGARGRGRRVRHRASRRRTSRRRATSAPGS